MKWKTLGPFIRQIVYIGPVSIKSTRVNAEKVRFPQSVRSYKINRIVSAKADISLVFFDDEVRQVDEWSITPLFMRNLELVLVPKYHEF
jgi:hypothetical protein